MFTFANITLMKSEETIILKINILMIELQIWSL